MAKSKGNRGHKLIYYLNRLGKKDKKQFRQYLKSPLLGNSAQGMAILDILEGKGTMEVIEPRWFKDEMIPESPMNEKKEHYIWVRLSVFMEKLQEFLAFLEYKGDPAAEKHYFLKACKDRGWEKFLLSGFHKAMRTLASSNGASTHRSRLELEILANDYLSTKATKDTDTRLGKVLDSLDSYFVLQKLTYACAAMNERMMWGEGPEPALLEPVLEHAGQGEAEMPANIQAYRHAFLMLRNTLAGEPAAESHFDRLLTIMNARNQLTRNEAVDLFTYAQNFCILQIHQKNRSYFQILRELYDGMLASGLILEKGLLSPNFYKNTVVLMCRIGEFTWTKNFIEAYRHKIGDDADGLAYRYNLAVLKFHQGAYAEVVSGLYHHIHLFENIYYGIGARIYLCKALWEQREFDWLTSTLAAFRQYLYRNKGLNSTDKARYVGFVKLLRQIVGATTGYPEKRQSLLREIEAGMKAAGEMDLYPWLVEILVKEKD